MSDADGEDFSGLAPSEVVEYRSLVGELTDPQGRRFDGPWHEHYAHNRTKQARFAVLESRRGGGQRAERPAPATASDEAAAAKLMRHPDYWKRPDLQDEARRLLEGTAAPQRPSQNEAASAREAAVRDALDDIGAQVEDPSGLAEAFGTLRADTQELALRILEHAGGDWAFWANRAQGSHAWRELHEWLGTLKVHSPADYAAIVATLEG